MSQNNVDYSQNPTGAELMDDYLAAVLANALTTNSGIQRPVYAKPGTFWVDTSVTPWLLKMYNGTKDVLFGKIGTDANGNFTVVNAANLDLNNITNSAVNRIRGIAGKPYNIGQIYQSTIPLTDAGLHLLDGTVLVGNGIYKDFVDYIADLYNAGTATNSFLTEAQWQAEVSNKGICGKFVYDSANNTVRLPLFGNKITCSENELITVGSSESPKTNQIWGTTIDNNTVSFAVSDANLIDGYYYIAVANQTKTDIEVNIDRIAADLANKADTDLSNLTSQGKNIANWSNNVTNCITEIPQDIKLELADGVLTLKAGSKVYVPNGVGVFDVITVSSDAVFHTGTIGSSTLDLMFCCNLTGGFGVRAELNYFESGSTEPSNTSHIWYDTTNNAIKAYENGSWVRKYSLPIGFYHRENGNAVSIKQVFNGFGYIGSTVFALPGVKGLIPNGRNVDGSLKNIEFTATSVKIYTSPTNYTFSNFGWVCDPVGNIIPYDLTKYAYREDENYNYEFYNNTIHKSSLIAYGSVNAGRITSFTPKTAFHAVDRNDSSWLSGLGMPSSRYIDLTLGASGTKYTAPANGWVFISKKTDGANQRVNIGIPNSVRNMALAPASGYSTDASIPVRAGQVFYCIYSAGGDLNFFRFVYAEGENS